MLVIGGGSCIQEFPPMKSLDHPLKRSVNAGSESVNVPGTAVLFPWPPVYDSAEEDRSGPGDRRPLTRREESPGSTGCDGG